MSEKHCETNCRENLIAKINKKIHKSVLLGIAGTIVVIIIALCSFGYSEVKENHVAIAKTREDVSAIGSTLKNIRALQMVILKEIRKE